MARKLKVLVGCEFSGVVRDAFVALGHEAVSCDLLPTERPWVVTDTLGHQHRVEGRGRHIQGDVLAILDDGWDLAIFHPPCTYLASSGLHWNKRIPGREQKTHDAMIFVLNLMGDGFVHNPIPRIALENPVGRISTAYRKPDQIIQPWEFGHPESKATCLWLKGLPPLKPTNVLPLPKSGRWNNQTPSGQNKLGPSPDRWKLRSHTYAGIAKAMAEQWSAYACTN